MGSSTTMLAVWLSTFVTCVVGEDHHHVTSSRPPAYSPPSYPPPPPYPHSHSKSPPGHHSSCPPVSTVTVTVTAPHTSTQKPSSTPSPGGACLLVKPSCQASAFQAASGFDIAYYSNVFGPAGFSSRIIDPNVPSSYYITEKLSPLATSMTNLTFYPQNDPPATTPTYPVGEAYPYYEGYVRDTNGGIIVNNNNFTLVYSGLFRAPSSGQYQLCTIGDNESDLFFGNDNAFSCLTGKPSTKATPLVKGYDNVFDPSAPLVGECATVNLMQGAYYPIRVVTGNYQGPSAFSLLLVAPGQTVDTGSRDFTGMAYPVDCGLYVNL